MNNLINLFPKFQARKRIRVKLIEQPVLPAPELVYNGRAFKVLELHSYKPQVKVLQLVAHKDTGIDYLVSVIELEENDFRFSHRISLEKLKVGAHTKKSRIFSVDGKLLRDNTIANNPHWLAIEIANTMARYIANIYLSRDGSSYKEIDELNWEQFYSRALTFCS